MKKIKEILKDIWENFKYQLLISWFIANPLIVYFSPEIERMWLIFLILIANGINISCITYGIIKYFQK